MSQNNLTIALFIIGSILSVTGFLSVFLLKGMSGNIKELSCDLKNTSTTVAEHNTLIKIIDLKVETKMSKLECLQKHSSKPV